MRQKVYMQSARALGSIVELRIMAESQTFADKWFAKSWKIVEKFQNQFSRFIPTSELTRLNQNAGQKMFITQNFKKLLDKSKYYSELTNGIFNPFLLPSIQKAGYIASLEPTNSGMVLLDYSDRKVVKPESLEIGGNWARIPKNSALDLGGIGKGYLADELAKTLDPYINDYCLSIGGDIIAKGSSENSSWSIDVQSLADPNLTCAVYSDRKNRFGIATSGNVRINGKRRQAHLINPATQKLAMTEFEMCSVSANDATTADVLASAILISGKEFANDLVNSGLINAVMFQKFNEKKSIDIVTLGLGFNIKETSNA